MRRRSFRFWLRMWSPENQFCNENPGCQVLVTDVVARQPLLQRKPGLPNQKIAIGLIGEPVAMGSRKGAMTQRNDQRCSASHTGTRSSNCR